MTPDRVLLRIDHCRQARAVLHVDDRLRFDRARRYTDEEGATLPGEWRTDADHGRHDLWRSDPSRSAVTSRAARRR